MSLAAPLSSAHVHVQKGGVPLQEYPYPAAGPNFPDILFGGGGGGSGSLLAIALTKPNQQCFLSKNSKNFIKFKIYLLV